MWSWLWETKENMLRLRAALVGVIELSLAVQCRIEVVVEVVQSKCFNVGIGKMV